MGVFYAKIEPLAREKMVGMDGIEPTSAVWKTAVLPLNDIPMVEPGASKPRPVIHSRGVYVRSG